MNSKAFDSRRIAEGYAKRPWLHKSVMDMLRKDLGIADDHIFKNGLDVGCGAGLSTKALRLICNKVTGTDIADSMIEVCKELYTESEGYSFYVTGAEEVDAPAEKYDIVTAAGMVNWVDEKKFLEAMKRVTSDEGLIVIYDFGITDKMVGNHAYTKWYNEEYLKRFPKPPRKENKWGEAEMIPGFVMEKQTDYEMEYAFNLNAFVDFMMIQSNVNAKVESGEMTESGAREWLKKSLEPIFENCEKRLVFYGYSWYIRRV